jgi:hypothetical protein
MGKLFKDGTQWMQSARVCFFAPKEMNNQKILQLCEHTVAPGAEDICFESAKRRCAWPDCFNAAFPLQ